MHPLRWILWPFSLVYQVIITLRAYFLIRFCQSNFPVPVIIVGNLTVGGVGKTPLVIAIAQKLQEQGIKVGIVSRGYGSVLTDFPHEVKLDDKASLVGDEPLLLMKKTGCPVVIAPNRVQAVRYLLEQHQSQIVISDDGLQHYRMGRCVEIVVLDGLRGLGNGMCLPAGPLRERSSRLKTVDFIVENGSSSTTKNFTMTLDPGQFTNLLNGATIESKDLSRPVAAMAGIGHPQRFFDSLEALGVSFNSYSFADHHPYQANELCFSEKMLVMTEKDAVKCTAFATQAMYYLPVEAKVSHEFWDALWAHKTLQGCIK
jgi:tetraacyldisaccharide 4'-kinase